MKKKQMIKDHIARVEDAILEDVIKPIRNLMNVWKQEIKTHSTETGSGVRSSNRDGSNITPITGRKPKTDKNHK